MTDQAKRAAADEPQPNDKPLPLSLRWLAEERALQAARERRLMGDETR